MGVREQEIFVWKKFSRILQNLANLQKFPVREYYQHIVLVSCFHQDLKLRRPSNHKFAKFSCRKIVLFYFMSLDLNNMSLTYI